MLGDVALRVEGSVLLPVLADVLGTLEYGEQLGGAGFAHVSFKRSVRTACAYVPLLSRRPWRQA